MRGGGPVASFMPKLGDENRKARIGGGWAEELFTCATLHMTSLIHTEVKQPCIPCYTPKDNILNLVNRGKLT